MTSRYKKGIYFLPTLFTVANVFCGFYAIIASMRKDTELAAALIGLAILFDILDGRVARMANATSDFGREFDSLADVISFGVAPGILLYSWGLHLMNRVGWLACFLFVICGAMRLARFNIQQKYVDKRFFVGLPIPAAAGVPAALVFMFPQPLESPAQAAPALALVVVLTFLMVSTFRYYSFKDFDLRRRQSYITVLLLALLFVAVGSHPQTMLLLMAGAYLVSGPALKVYSLFRKSHRKPGSQDEPLATSSASKGIDG
jgi:CDP-diacylglycerol--serine O-phosphatidyltransferase